MNRVMKAIFLGIISFLLISAGIFVPLGYNFYVSGQSRLAELQRQVENRGAELTLALARLATEQWGPKGMVSVSSAMNEVVLATSRRTDEVLVKEILIVDREGTLQAHNDFTRLAKGAEVSFDADLQQKILRLTERNPVWQVKKTEFQNRPYYLPLFQYLFPQLIANHYVFGGAVFSLDGPIHWGGLHMRVEVRSVERVMAEVMNDLIVNGLIALVVSLAVTTLVVGLFLLMGPGGRTGAAADARGHAEKIPAAPYEGLEPYDDGEIAYESHGQVDADEEQDPYADEEIAGGRILDAIPLDRTGSDRTRYH